MKYFKVAAKCGHVGRGHYIIKNFFVKAENGKDAAYKVRFSPRVKHDWKDAIVSVVLVTIEEYVQGRNRQNQDLYFNVTNSSDQKLYGAIDYDEVLDYDAPERKKRDKGAMFYNKMARIQRKDLRMRLVEAWTIVKEIDRKKRKERTVLKKSFLWVGVLLCSRKEIMFKLIRG